MHRTTGAQIYLYYTRIISVGDYTNTFVVVVVKVVLEVDSRHGYVETAHLTNRKKRRAVLEWSR